MSFGGGAGCGGTTTGNCGSAVDANSQPAVSTVMAAVAAALDSSVACKSQRQVCGSGGGGGGVVQMGNQCNWGGSFSYAFAQAIVGDETPCASTQAGGNGAGAAAQACSKQCSPTANFNTCFCPCFKARVTKAGATWAHSMSCAPDGL